MFNETKEALERQTATAEILKVIAASPSDVQPVFEAIAERSNRLIGGRGPTAVYSVDEDAMYLEGLHANQLREPMRLCKLHFPGRCPRAALG